LTCVLAKVAPDPRDADRIKHPLLSSGYSYQKTFGQAIRALGQWLSGP
jgi:hypothetical protein